MDAGDFEEVVWILERLPNRDAPPGERTDWDEFLDDYSEYLKVLYAICGALGDTPEVEALAMGWANGRVQIKQSAESAWASIVNGNPGLGMHHLKQLAWRFIGKEYVSRQFPDFTPEEEAESRTRRERKRASQTAWDHFEGSSALAGPGEGAQAQLRCRPKQIRGRHDRQGRFNHAVDGAAICHRPARKRSRLDAERLARLRQDRA